MGNNLNPTPQTRIIMKMCQVAAHGLKSPGIASRPPKSGLGLERVSSFRVLELGS